MIGTVRPSPDRMRGRSRGHGDGDLTEHPAGRRHSAWPIFSENDETHDQSSLAEALRSVPSVLGTGSIVLNRANAAPNVPDSGSNTVPWYSGGAFSTPYTRGQVEPLNRYLQLSRALPTGSPADFPMVLNYNSNSGTTSRVWRQLVRSLSSVRGTRRSPGGRCQGVQPSRRPGDIQPSRLRW